MEDRRTGSPSEPSGGQHLAFKLLAPGTVGEGYSVAGHPLVRGHRPQQPWGTNRQTVGQFWFCIQAGTTLQRREQASVGRWGGPVTGVGNQSSGQCVWEEYLNRIRNGKEERGRKRRHKALQKETLGTKACDRRAGSCVRHRGRVSPPPLVDGGSESQDSLLGWMWFHRKECRASQEF